MLGEFFMMDGWGIFLISMLWELVLWFSLVIGILVEIVCNVGFDCFVFYFNFEFLVKFGCVYDVFVENIDLFVFGEYFFVVDLFGVEVFEFEVYLV